MNKLLKLLRFFYKIPICSICWIIYTISGFIPKNKKLWVFAESRENFADNTKYMYLYAGNYDITKVWLTYSRDVIKHLNSINLLAYHRFSIKGVYYAFVANVVFFDTYIDNWIFYFCKGSKKFNLWHGMPIKVIEYDISSGFNYKVRHKLIYKLWYKFGLPKAYCKLDYMLATNNDTSKNISQAFRTQAEMIISLQPRTYIWNFDENKLLQELSKFKDFQTISILNKMNKCNKVYIYMPTWRDDNSVDIDEVLGVENLINTLESNNHLLLIKLHYNDYHIYQSSIVSDNIIMIDPKIDVYPLLKYTDVLISDYSSIIIDYLLLNKPIYFYCYDLDNYLANCREMYYDYKKQIICGKVVNSLLEVIEDQETDMFVDKRNKAYNLFFNENNNYNIMEFTE